MQSGFASRMMFNRLYVGLLIFAFLIIGGVAIFAYVSYQKAVNDLVIERDRELVQLSASRFLVEMEKYAGILEAVAREIQSDEQFLINPAVSLNTSRTRLSVFDGGVLFIDNFGKVSAAIPSSASLIGRDLSDRLYFTELLSGISIYYSDAIMDGPGPSEVVVISTPVIGKNGEFSGALAGMFLVNRSTVSAFNASVVRLRLGQTGTTYVIDGNHRILYRSDLVAENGDQGSLSLNWLAIEGDVGAIRTRDPENNDIVAGYARIPSTRWTLITEDDWRILASNSLGTSRMLLGILAAGMIIPALGIVVLLRYQKSEGLRKGLLTQDTEISNRFQRMMIPETTPVLPGWRIDVKFTHTQEIRSEFHDILVLPDGNLMLVCGRMEGSGMVCSFNIATLRAVFRSLAVLPLTPAEVMHRSNILLMHEIQTGSRISCIYSILNPSNGHLTYVSAGQQHPYLFINGKSDDNPVTGPFLGETWESEYTFHEIMLQPEDCLIFMSGGFNSLRNKYAQLYGEERVTEVLSKLSYDQRDNPRALELIVQELTVGIPDKNFEYTLLSLERLAEIEDFLEHNSVSTRYYSQA